MDSENNSGPPLCANGCGFFGSPHNRNLCSRCYRDFLEDELAEHAKKLSKLKISTKLDITPPPVAVIDETTTTDATSLSSTVKKNRCQCCNKKVGLLGFNCRCGKILCGVHRYAKEHACTFDYKTVDRQVLEKQNPFVVADKLGDRI